nr:MBL fold metallo-hydrolase [Kineosporia babensis]
MIGGSVILVSTPKARVLLDFGMRGLNQGLLRSPSGPRPGYELVDLLRAQELPDAPGIYDPAQLTLDPTLAAARAAAADPRPTAVFLSHAHIDHEGALGFLDPSIAVYASVDTVKMLDALNDTGQPRPGRTLRPIPVAEGERIQLEDITVEVVLVEHDVPGASGIIVTTPEGTLVYTGDINFHRNEGRRSHAFAERIRGVEMLVTETTMLSHGKGNDRPVRSEAEIDEIFTATLQRVPGLVLLSAYSRDVERAVRLIELARRNGREVIWPSRDAALLHAMGATNVSSWAPGRPEQDPRPLPESVNRVSMEQVVAEPGRYVVQPDGHDAPALADLPVVAASTVWVHSQGEPLGPFMPNWHVFQDWLGKLGIDVVAAGSSGHATRADLLKFIEFVAPGCVVPIHGTRPEDVEVSVARLLPEYGAVYRLDGSVVE